MVNLPNFNVLDDSIMKLSLTYSKYLLTVILTVMLLIHIYQYIRIEMNFSNDAMNHSCVNDRFPF